MSQTDVVTQSGQFKIQLQSAIKGLQAATSANSWYVVFMVDLEDVTDKVHGRLNIC